MDAQDDISDFEYSDSEYSDIDEIENTRDALEKLSLKSPESLESKVAKAISSPEALSNYLFKIRNASNADDLIIWILEMIVEGGHVESYKFMIPEFFKQAELYYRRIRVYRPGYCHFEDSKGRESVFKFDTAIRGMFARAMNVKSRPIVHDIIDCVLDPCYGGRNTVYWPSRWADRDSTLLAFQQGIIDHQGMRKEVLMHLSDKMTEMSSLAFKLNWAVRHGRLDLAGPLISRILSAEIVTRIVWTSHLDGNGKVSYGEASEPPEIQRLKALEDSLRGALQRSGPGGPDAVRILLPPYLSCMTKVHGKFPQSTWDGYVHYMSPNQGIRGSVLKILTETALESIISREDSLRFLNANLPPVLKVALIRCIQVLDEKQREEWLVVRAGGNEFKAHKETVRYWSRYFAGLLRPNSAWADRECVEFGDDIESDVMEAALNFMHTGKLVDPRSLSGLAKDELIDEILIAADYLQIDTLISEIRSPGRRKSLLAQGIKTRPQQCGDIISPLKIEKGLATRSDTQHEPKKRRLNPETA